MIDLDNAIADAITNQRSIRAFKSDPVSDETLNAIFDAARFAPSAGGMQHYSVIVTKNPERLKEFRKVHQGNFAAIYAPTLLTYCVDVRRLTRWMSSNRGRPGYHNFWGFMFGVLDAAMFAQNVNLMAQSMGLGGCFVGSAINYANEIVDFLECPSGVVPLITYAIGVPDEFPERHTRLPANILVHSETYQDLSEFVLNDEYEEHGLAMFTKYMGFPGLEQAANDLDINNKNMAEIWSKLTYVTEQLEAAATWYLNTLRQQGFLDRPSLIDIDQFCGIKQSSFYKGLTLFCKILVTYMTQRSYFVDKSNVNIEQYYNGFLKHITTLDPLLYQEINSEDTYLLSAQLAETIEAAISKYDRTL